VNTVFPVLQKLALLLLVASTNAVTFAVSLGSLVEGDAT
jgi:hypothetical protein